MKRFKKKALALLLTAVMVVAMAPAAFAGTFSDVSADADYAGAVERLAGLGVVNGMGDGTFAPDGTFTRAQAAKIAVVLRGIKSAGQSPTEFSDVSSSHWASGWINMATGLGIIKGMGDGTFAPDAPVTHAQWLTMVLRVMGYGPVVDNKAWPAGVLAQAALLDLDKGVNVIANLPATRAEVAVVADNSLTGPLMVLSGVDANGKETYSQSDTKTIAGTYLKSSQVKGMLVGSADLFGNFDSQQISVDDGAAVSNMDLVDGTDAAGLLGHDVTAWKNSDGKVFFVEDRSAANTKSGFLKADNGTLTFDGKNVETAATVIVIRNGVDEGAATTIEADGTILDANTPVNAGDEATVVFDANGKAQAIVANSYNVAIVDSVSTTLEKIVFKGAAGSLILKDDTVRWSGAAAKLADVQADDVVQYLENGTEAVVIVTRNAKTGDYTKLSGTKVTVGGTEYETNGYAPAATNLGKSVTVLLDKDGKVADMSLAEAEAAKTIAAVTTAPYSGVDGQGNTIEFIKVFKADGSKAILVINSDKVDTTATVISEGDVISYTLDADGKVNGVTIEYNNGTDAPAAMAVNKDTHKVGAYVMAGTTLYFDYTTYATSTDTADIAVATQADIEANDGGNATVWVVADPDSPAKASIIVMTAGTLAASDNTFGGVMDEYQNADADYVLSIMTGGTVSDYVYGAATSGLAAGTIVEYTVSGSDIASVTAMTAAHNGILSGDTWVKLLVSDIDTSINTIYLAGYQADGTTATGETGSIMVNADTQYLDGTGTDLAAADLGDIAKDSTVEVYDADADGVAEVVVIK